MNLSNYDFKKSIKRGCVYLLIAMPFMLIFAVLLTILNAPQWATMLVTVVVGGVAVLICMLINSKRLEKRKEENKNKFDPFRD